MLMSIPFWMWLLVLMFVAHADVDVFDGFDLDVGVTLDVVGVVYGDVYGDVYGVVEDVSDVIVATGVDVDVDIVGGFLW